MRSTAVLAMAVWWAFCSTHAAEIDVPGLFRQLDADANGRVTLTEAGAEQGLQFRRMLRTGDEDGDGALSPEELAAASVLLAKMDADENSELEPREIPSRFKPLFQQMLRVADGNGDRKLARREIARSAPRLALLAQAAARRM
jgi:hypothetical protein